MRRREFIALFGAATGAWPLAARAQQPEERMRRIGVLEETAEDDKERNSQFAKFREGLAIFGWVEGRTIQPSRERDYEIAMNNGRAIRWQEEPAVRHARERLDSAFDIRRASDRRWNNLV
jgi:hypothetical protein